MPVPARSRGLLVLILAAAALAGIAWLGHALLIGAAATRMRQAAADRGLRASWRGLALRLPARLEVRGLAMASSAGDTVMRAESLAVDLDPGSLLALHPRAARIAVAHARLLRPRPPAVESDTLLESAPPAGAVAARIRRSAESLSRLLLAPARRLPAIRLRDLTVDAPPSEESLFRGAVFERLDLTHPAGGTRVEGGGRLTLGHEVGFALDLTWGGDDRLRGRAWIAVPDSARDAVDTLRVALDGAVHQDRRAGRVTIADGTRLRLGRMPFALGGAIESAGPRARLTLDVLGLDQAAIVASLPPPVLGPLADLAVQGSFDWHAALDLDLARPDSVQFEADVVPHGLALDPARTRLPILGLDGPFTATIHLPHGRIAVRELSPANPFYRPLWAIDTTLVHAVLTNEDGGFFRHRGFNLEAVRLAIAANLRAGAYRRGAGTVTMQLARNLWLGHERTLSRKFQEVVLAWVLEHLTGLSKQRLLEIYLNVIEWGPEVHGAAEATRFYFDGDPGQVTVPEALFLTIVVPSPTRWRARVGKDGELRPWARAQMHFIGRAMVARSWLDPERLPPADSLRIELRGAARSILFPEGVPEAPGPPAVEAAATAPAWPARVLSRLLHLGRRAQGPPEPRRRQP